jgi:heptosyltransferase-2
VTDAPSDQLLRGHSQIDRVLTTKGEDLLSLAALEFDVAIVVDKSLKASGVLAQTRCREVFGFRAEAKTGSILPATVAAEELWRLGLDNHQKFFVNQKPETQLMIEAFELGPYQRDEYDLPLTLDERTEAARRRRSWLGNKKWILGINTGCSSVIPYKKLSVDFQRLVIENVCRDFPEVAIVLLGGPEDTERNRAIAAGLALVQSPTEAGLRDGLTSVAAVDVVLTGDSLGMHMAIAQKKHVIAWFGPTCAAEIDLYDRGEKLQTKAPCAPCWKRRCEHETLCYDLVSMNEVLAALARSFIRCSPPSALHGFRNDSQVCDFEL